MPRITTPGREPPASRAPSEIFQSSAEQLGLISWPRTETQDAEGTGTADETAAVRPCGCCRDLDPEQLLDWIHHNAATVLVAAFQELARQLRGPGSRQEPPAAASSREGAATGVREGTLSDQRRRNRSIRRPP